MENNPKLMVRPEVFQDESLESYLLRLLLANGFDSFQTFSAAIIQYIELRDGNVAGAFPQFLQRANIYHANVSSSFRLRAFRLINTLTDQELPTLALSVMHSRSKFGGHKAVFRRGIDIPRCFLREEGIPVCPLCLRDCAYIKQLWHLKPYTACHLHRSKLMHQCPKCSETLDYRKTEQLGLCACGFDLTSYAVELSVEEDLIVSGLIAGDSILTEDRFLLFSDLNPSQVLGVLFWYERIQLWLSVNGMEDDTTMLSFFSRWPFSLVMVLEKVIAKKLATSVQSLNKVSFRSFFGTLLKDAQCLPDRELGSNPVLKEIITFLSETVEKNPRSKVPNIGDLLVSLSEAAALLSTTYEQVYLLYSEGYLPLQTHIGINTKLKQEVPAFYLRNILDLRLSQMQSTKDSHSQYLPAW